jgi:hypothetical protein
MWFMNRGGRQRAQMQYFHASKAAAAILEHRAGRKKQTKRAQKPNLGIIITIRTQRQGGKEIGARLKLAFEAWHSSSCISQLWQHDLSPVFNSGCVARKSGLLQFQAASIYANKSWYHSSLSSKHITPGQSKMLAVCLVTSS